MKSNKYSYLKQYVDQGKERYALYENVFWSLNTQNEITESETRLGFAFPDSLKEFWKEVGIGHLTTPHNAKGRYVCGPNNEFLSPSQIADIILLKEDSGLILPEAVEYMPDDEMPFFEVGDLSSFLTMKPLSDKPNAVWGFGELIEEEFGKFIWRLYYESPTYYLNVNK